MNTWVPPGDMPPSRGVSLKSAQSCRWECAAVSLEEMEFIRSSEAVHTFFWPGVGAVGAPGLSGPNDGFACGLYAFH